MVRQNNPRILILSGGSACGKSTVVRLATSRLTGVTTHRKSTSRPERVGERHEIDCRPSWSPAGLDYVYSQYGFFYGIQRSQIERSLDLGLHHILICNDRSTIKRLRDDYHDRVTTAFVHSNATIDDIRSIQTARGLPTSEAERRIAKHRKLNAFAYDTPDAFDTWIENCQSKEELLVEAVASILQAAVTPMVSDQLDSFVSVES